MSKALALTPDSKPVFKRSIYARQWSEGRVLLAFHPGEALALDLTPQQERLLLLLDGERTVAEMVAGLNFSGVLCTVPEALAGLNRLYEQCLLEDRAAAVDPEDFSKPELARYERNLLFYAARQAQGAPLALASQERLSKATVALIGLGGGGSHIFTGLAALGVGNLILLDYDQVEASNLNRQSIYREPDLGRSKIEVLREIAPQINSGISYSFVEKRLACQADLEQAVAGADLAILAADSPREKIFTWMDRACHQTGVPALFSLGVTPSHVRVGPLVVPGQTPCFCCAMPPPPEEGRPLVGMINRRYRHGVIIPQVQMLGSLICWEALKFLTGIAPCRILGRVLHFNFLDYDIRIDEVQPRDTCAVCAGLGGAD